MFTILFFFFFFKQKTAYEMLRSLVGSEMCIRDSINAEYGDLTSFSGWSGSWSPWNPVPTSTLSSPTPYSPHPLAVRMWSYPNGSWVSAGGILIIAPARPLPQL
eukprot:TRINITY_DN6835_c0_g1_i7.p3 TRINITY_DN6835_c0_g1~~TRINITY_DN6835_c0_g1_i7.p3  ORF type:complete len:104 (-),score=29.85 TRINITY_DN6835_c0_g1_i7:278-589(-)